VLEQERRKHVLRAKSALDATYNVWRVSETAVGWPRRYWQSRSWKTAAKQAVSWSHVVERWEFESYRPSTWRKQQSHQQRVSLIYDNTLMAVWSLNQRPFESPLCMNQLSKSSSLSVSLERTAVDVWTELATFTVYLVSILIQQIHACEILRDCQYNNIMWPNEPIVLTCVIIHSVNVVKTTTKTTTNNNDNNDNNNIITAAM